MKGYLVLENGRVFEGKLLNDCRQASGEVVFSTAMISYQDVITDPSYYGQIVVMTYPLVGNVGFSARSLASSGAMVKGLVMREATDFPSHYDMDTDLISFLNKSEIAVLTQVDTRALTRLIRSEGAMGGVITDNIDNKEWLISKAGQASRDLQGDLVKYVTRRNTMKFGSGQHRVVLIDLGTKRGIINSLTGRDCEVIAVPAATEDWEVLRMHPDGVLVSDGPGDPHALPYVVELCRELLGKVPLFGIGLGHQVLALSMGAEAVRLNYGHRGTNHPVRSLDDNRVYITAQNHGFVLDEESLTRNNIEITMRSLNDNTVEGIRHSHWPVFSIQFDPEGYPGYSETGFFIDRFIQQL